MVLAEKYAYELRIGGTSQQHGPKEARAALSAHLSELSMGEQAKPNHYGTNSGHGHVWARPDGAKARCGGPKMCPQCARDLAHACDPKL